MRSNPACLTTEPGWNGAERSAKSEKRMRSGMEDGFRKGVRHQVGGGSLRTLPAVAQSRLRTSPEQQRSQSDACNA
jgi:hypothetical protein